MPDPGGRGNKRRFRVAAAEPSYSYCGSAAQCSHCERASFSRKRKRKSKKGFNDACLGFIIFGWTAELDE